MNRTNIQYKCLHVQTTLTSGDLFHLYYIVVVVVVIRQVVGGLYNLDTIRRMSLYNV